MRKVAEIIIRSNPDTVNLVEVENKQALETFNNRFLSDRGHVTYFVKVKDTYTSQDVRAIADIKSKLQAWNQE